MFSFLSRVIRDISHLASYRSDWPLTLKLLRSLLPVTFLICILAAWAGYMASWKALQNSIISGPLMEVKAQASVMSEDLSRLRNSMCLIAKSLEENNKDFRDALEEKFQSLLPIVGEIGCKSQDGSGFILIRSNHEFLEYDLKETTKFPYSAVQQLPSTPVEKGSFTLFPAVISDVFLKDGSLIRKPLLRMATRLDTGQILFLGIDMDRWGQKLSVFTSEQSPLYTELQNDVLQLSYFFDLQGWVLFESSNKNETGQFRPDMARKGFSGDLGRIGFDAAFRPSAEHTPFWGMVMDTKEGKSGTQKASAGVYFPSYGKDWASVCYAPVFFENTQGGKPIPIGGIAFLETSTLPYLSFYNIINATFLIAIFCITLFTIIIYRMGKKISQPLRSMAANLEKMQKESSFYTFSAAPMYEEFQRLQTGINGIIMKILAVEKDLKTMRTRQNQAPADLPDRLPAMHSLAQDLLEEGQLIGSGQAISRVREMVKKAAKTGADVLVWGETGTGKELVAAAIHKASIASEGPFISINCGALDENLLLDTLFGHVKGAFSDARGERKGAFLAANGGTLHLDEIGNASLKVQQSLLRALAVRRIRPLGTDREIPFNARVIAATNVDLRESVKRGTFREDLYYRLAIISITTPPLREHKEDIPELAAYYIHTTAEAEGLPDARISKGALELLTAYDWPGNVRELKNCIIRALAFAEGDIILKEHIALEYDSYATFSSYHQELHKEQAQPDDIASLPADYLWPSANNTTVEEQQGKVAQPKENKSSPFDETSLPGTLNRRQRRALQIIMVQGGITRAQYEEIVGKKVTSRTAQNDLRQLIEWGVLEKQGAGPATYYILKKKEVGQKNDSFSIKSDQRF